MIVGRVPRIQKIFCSNMGFLTSVFTGVTSRVSKIDWRVLCQKEQGENSRANFAKIMSNWHVDIVSHSPVVLWKVFPMYVNYSVLICEKVLCLLDPCIYTPGNSINFVQGMLVVHVLVFYNAINCTFWEKMVKVVVSSPTIVISRQVRVIIMCAACTTHYSIGSFLQLTWRYFCIIIITSCWIFIFKHIFQLSFVLCWMDPGI